MPAEASRAADRECMDCMLETFFSAETMTGTVGRMLSCIDFSQDQFIAKVAVLLKQPLSCAFSGQGLVPFRHDTTFILPFSRMSRDELTICRCMLSLMSESAMTQQCAHDMGQSFVFLTPRKREHADVESVLVAISVLVHNTLRDTEYDALALLNVVMQRVRNLVFVSDECWQNVVARFTQILADGAISAH